MSTTVEHRLSPALVEALRADRDSFNTRFAERQLAGNRIGGEEFLHHLAAVIDPIVRAVAERYPERARATVHELYDVSLNLFAESLLGTKARSRHINEVWQSLLPAAATHVAQAPARVAGCLSNAAYHISSQTGTRPDWWIGRMINIAPSCDRIDELLDAGKVLAWQAGMAQYRTAALETARRLSASLMRRIFNLAASTSPEDIAARLDRLEADPWFSVEAQSPEPVIDGAIDLVRTGGAFRGFGGAFLRPPAVTYADGCFFATDGELIWQFVADAYGWHMQSRGTGSLPSNHKQGDLVIESDGTIRWAKHKARFPQLASSSSFACDGTTLAVTVPTSHHIFLLAER